jgi:hypothetical protein
MPLMAKPLVMEFPEASIPRRIMLFAKRADPALMYKPLIVAVVPVPEMTMEWMKFLSNRQQRS